MFNPDEVEPLRVVGKKQDLQDLSVDELRAYTATLKAELLRVEELITQKEAYRSGLDALFGG